MTAKAPHCITNANATDAVSEATTTTDVQSGSMPRGEACEAPISKSAQNGGIGDCIGCPTVHFFTSNRIVFAALSRNYMAWR